MASINHKPSIASTIHICASSLHSPRVRASQRFVHVPHPPQPSKLANILRTYMEDPAKEISNVVVLVTDAVNPEIQKAAVLRYVRWHRYLDASRTHSKSKRPILTGIMRLTRLSIIHSARSNPPQTLARRYSQSCNGIASFAPCPPYASPPSRTTRRITQCSWTSRRRSTSGGLP